MFFSIWEDDEFQNSPCFCLTFPLWFPSSNLSNYAYRTFQMGFQFAGKAIYTAVWVAAFSLFMELLGFSTQKWLTAGGLGTVLLTLAGREVQHFSSFLFSSISVR